MQWTERHRYPNMCWHLAVLPTSKLCGDFARLWKNINFCMVGHVVCGSTSFRTSQRQQRTVVVATQPKRLQRPLNNLAWYDVAAANTFYNEILVLSFLGIWSANDHDSTDAVSPWKFVQQGKKSRSPARQEAQGELLVSDNDLSSFVSRCLVRRMASW